MNKLSTIPLQQKLHYTLRFAVAMCFIGHGIFGIITKPVWCNYFAVFGVSSPMAYQLMPPLGVVDILLGITMLVYPMRVIPLWLVIWGFITAMLRPLSGEPLGEFIERAANFGTPLALLLMSAGTGESIKSWFMPIDPNSQADAKTLSRVITCLRIVVFLLLAGHGWLNLIEKKGLIGQYTRLGFSNPATVAHLVGAFEITAGIAVLVRPFRSLLLALFIWKITTELFYPHYEMVEWIERGGSYGAILALWFALGAEGKPSAEMKNMAVG